MKTSAMFYVALTTFVLVMLTIMVSMNMAFIWVFYTMCLGQALVIVMVYKVLKDKYTTDKTFKHFYEDRPINYR
jgi:4-hydroxybenzoate polyprenyltransferase